MPALATLFDVDHGQFLSVDQAEGSPQCRGVFADGSTFTGTVFPSTGAFREAVEVIQKFNRNFTTDAAIDGAVAPTPFDESRGWQSDFIGYFAAFHRSPVGAPGHCRGDSHDGQFLSVEVLFGGSDEFGGFSFTKHLKSRFCHQSWELVLDQASLPQRGKGAVAGRVDGFSVLAVNGVTEGSDHSAADGGHGQFLSVGEMLGDCGFGVPQGVGVNNVLTVDFGDPHPFVAVEHSFPHPDGRGGVRSVGGGPLAGSVVFPLHHSSSVPTVVGTAQVGVA
jgi:hypothetical protein